MGPALSAASSISLLTPSSTVAERDASEPSKNFEMSVGKVVAPARAAVVTASRQRKSTSSLSHWLPQPARRPARRPPPST